MTIVMKKYKDIARPSDSYKIAKEKTRLTRLEIVSLSSKARWFVKGERRPKFQLST